MSSFAPKDSRYSGTQMGVAAKVWTCLPPEAKATGPAMGHERCETSNLHLPSSAPLFSFQSLSSHCRIDADGHALFQTTVTDAKTRIPLPVPPRILLRLCIHARAMERSCTDILLFL